MKKEKNTEIKDSLRPNLYDYLKVFAILTMIIDHIWYYIFPDVIWFRLIWRMAFPIFLFLVWFSWSYRRRWNIFIWAIIIIVFNYFVRRKFWFWPETIDILAGIILARLVLSQLHKVKKKWVFAIIIFVLLISHPFVKEYLSYGTLPIIFAIWWYLARFYKEYFSIWIFFFVLLFINSILIFGFWYFEGNYFLPYVLAVFFWCLYCLFSLLKDENTPLHLGNLFDKTILWISKNALHIYGIHIIILCIIWLAYYRNLF
jgi:hypothetical protein